MLDKSKFHIVQMALPNLHAYIDKNRHIETNEYLLRPEFAEFANTAATKFPQWTFYGLARPYRNHDNVAGYLCRIEELSVYDGKEYLGKAWLEHSRGDYMFKVENERIENAVQRGRGKGSKDINKVLKTMAKTFGRKTLAERMKEATETTRYAVGQNESDARLAHDRAFNGLIYALHNHVAENLDTYIPIAVAAGTNAEMVSKIPELLERMSITKEIQTCHNKGEGAVVMIHGSDYAVREVVNGESVLNIYATDTLPEWLKRGVGMLKLVEVRDSISGVGCRAAESVYFVIKRADV